MKYNNSFYNSLFMFLCLYVIVHMFKPSTKYCGTFPNEKTVSAKTSVHRSSNGVYADDELVVMNSKGNMRTFSLLNITGTIVMYGGSIPPDGWQLCDGSKSSTDALERIVGQNVPDLRNRFVVGAGGNYTLGSKGGSNSVTLTTSQLPSHNHGINDPGHSHDFSVKSQADAGKRHNEMQRGSNGSGSWDRQGVYTSKTGISIQNAGGGAAHENRPPFYAITFMIKT